jgi:hypothetical protein
MDADCLRFAVSSLDAALAELDRWEKLLGDAVHISPEELRPLYDGDVGRLARLRAYVTDARSALHG